MTITETVRAMVASGCTPQQILAAVEAMEKANEDALAKRRASDAARQQAKRDREKQGHVTERDVTVTVASRAGASRADTSTTNSSVPPQGSKEETSKSVSAKPRRVMCLMPDDFVPKPETFEKANREWGFGRMQVISKRDALHDWSHGNNERRADWDLVLQGALRRDFEAAQKTGSRDRPTSGSANNWPDILKATRAVIEAETENPTPTNVIDLKALSH